MKVLVFLMFISLFSPMKHIDINSYDKTRDFLIETYGMENTETFNRIGLTSNQLGNISEMKDTDDTRYLQIILEDDGDGKVGQISIISHQEDELLDYFEKLDFPVPDNIEITIDKVNKGSSVLYEYDEKIIYFSQPKSGGCCYIRLAASDLHKEDLKSLYENQIYNRN